MARKYIKGMLKGARENENGYAKPVFFPLSSTESIMIEVNESNKEGVKYWVRARKVKKNKKSNTL